MRYPSDLPRSEMAVDTNCQGARLVARDRRNVVRDSSDPTAKSWPPIA